MFDSGFSKFKKNLFFFNLNDDQEKFFFSKNSTSLMLWSLNNKNKWNRKANLPRLIDNHSWTSVWRSPLLMQKTSRTHCIPALWLLWSVGLGRLLVLFDYFHLYLLFDARALSYWFCYGWKAYEKKRGNIS